MNRQTLFKSSLTIVCSLLLLGMFQKLSHNFVAVAQSPLIKESTLKNLSPQEARNLASGKVVLKGQKGNYFGQTIALGDINTAWEVLTDYDRFDRFLPNISSSQIIEEDDARVLFEQVNVVDLWLFQEKFTVQIEAIKTKPNKVDFKLADGELKKLVGRWTIEEVEPGKILIAHAVEVEPGSDTEKPFFYGIYESSLEETLKAIAVEITKRSGS